MPARVIDCGSFMVTKVSRPPRRIWLAVTTTPSAGVGVWGWRSPSTGEGVWFVGRGKVGEVGALVVSAAVAAAGAEQAAAVGVVGGDTSPAVAGHPGPVVVTVGQADGDGDAARAVGAPVEVEVPALVHGVVVGQVRGVEVRDVALVVVLEFARQASQTTT